ncbi:MAG: hypothetical protein J6O71_00665 [Lachnospiraceae bacterium]|nr:hypothetical protein [Lachnospiraceae bacterium]
MEQVNDLKNARPEEINLERAQNMVSAASQTVVNEFNTGKHLSGKSKRRRKKAFESKKTLYDSSAAKTWRKDREEGRQDWRVPQGTALQQTGAPAAQAVTITASIANIRKMHDCTMDFLNYDNDTQFIAHFNDAYAQLNTFAGLKDALSNPTEAELKTLKDNKLPDIEKLRESVGEYTRIRDFYRAKMDVISSPFYMVLRKTDTDKLTVDEIEQNIQKCRTAHRDKLADYLEAIKTLKTLKNNNVEHNLKASVRKQTGGGMDKKKGAYFALGVRDYGIETSASSGLKYSPEKDFTGYNTEAHNEYWEKRDQALEEKWKEQKKNASELDNASLNIFDVGVGVSASANIAEVGAYAGSTHRSLSAVGKGAVGAVKASGKIGASLALDTKDIIKGEIGISGDASASVAKGRVSASAFKNFKHAPLGAYLDTQGDVLTANASAVAKLGRFNMNINGQDVALTGGAVMISAQAAFATGSISGGLNLFGVKIGITLSGQLGGAGITTGGYVSTSRIGCSLGALVGMGGTASLDVDFSHWTDKIISSLRKNK